MLTEIEQIIHDLEAIADEIATSASFEGRPSDAGSLYDAINLIEKQQATIEKQALALVEARAWFNRSLEALETDAATDFYNVARSGAERTIKQVANDLRAKD